MAEQRFYELWQAGWLIMRAEGIAAFKQGLDALKFDLDGSFARAYVKRGGILMLDTSGTVEDIVADAEIELDAGNEHDEVLERLAHELKERTDLLASIAYEVLNSATKSTHRRGALLEIGEVTASVNQSIERLCDVLNNKPRITAREDNHAAR